MQVTEEVASQVLYTPYFLKKIVGTTINQKMNVSGASTCVGTILIVIALCAPTLCLIAPEPGKYEKIKFGKGNEPTDRPVAKCVKLSQEKLQFKCEVGIHEVDDTSKSCDLIVTPERGMNDIEIDLVYQLPGKKLLFLWQATSGRPEGFSRNLQTIDINNCKISKKMYFPRFSHDWRNLEKLIIYEDDSFETIFSDISVVNQRGRKTVSATFDTDGRRIKISAIRPGASLLSGHANRKIKNIIEFEHPSAELEESILHKKVVKPDVVQT